MNPVECELVLTVDVVVLDEGVLLILEDAWMCVGSVI